MVNFIDTILLDFVKLQNKGFLDDLVITKNSIRRIFIPFKAITGIKVRPFILVLVIKDIKG